MLVNFRCGECGTLAALACIDTKGNHNIHIFTLNRNINTFTHIIENADATPPHLEVTLRLVRYDGVQGSLQVFAGLCIWVVQLFFVNCTCAPAWTWNVDMLKACMSESSTETNVSSPDAS